MPQRTGRKYTMPVGQKQEPSNDLTVDPTAEVLALTGITLVRNDSAILAGINWRVRPGERWVVLGPNGSGKTSLCQIITLYQHPSAGSVTVLGATLGHTDVRSLRLRIGITSAPLAAMMQPKLTVEQIVVAGLHAALSHWWHNYEDSDWRQARHCLERVNCLTLADHRFGTLSSGERQRVLLARALMCDPGLLVLDEPNAGLDLPGREQLVQTLANLAANPTAPPLILVSHHVDEIPPGFTHALLLVAGRITASGPIEHVLTGAQLSRCFGLDVEIERRGGRWRAWANQPPRPL